MEENCIIMATKLQYVMRLQPCTHRAVSCRVVPDEMNRSCSPDGKVFTVRAHQRRAPLLFPASLRTHTGIRVQADEGSDLRCGAVRCGGGGLIHEACSAARSLSGSPPLCFDEMQSEHARVDATTINAWTRTEVFKLYVNKRQPLLIQTNYEFCPALSFLLENVTLF